jgi:TonB family protein
MTLLSCPVCGGSVSANAAACPHCGEPRSRRPVSGRADRPLLIIAGAALVFAALVAMVGWLALRQVAARQAPARRPPEELVDYQEVTDSASGTAATADVSADSTWELSAVEEPPELANRGEMVSELGREYPPLLRDAGVEGEVTVRFRIRADGAPDPASIGIEQSTHPLFADAAGRVVREMRFRPAKLGGRPVAVWATIPVRFQLQR